MNIVFLYPDVEVPLYPFDPLGVASLAAVAGREGHRTSLVPVKSADPAEWAVLERQIRARQPDAFAISVVTNQWRTVQTLLPWLDRTFGARPAILGGYHPTLCPDQVMACPEVRCLCRGEGEEPFRGWLEALPRGGDGAGIPGLWVKNAGGTIVRTPTPALRRDLDLLPDPDLSLFDPWGRSPAERRRLFVVAGRGCPLRCAYCCNEAYHDVHEGSSLTRRVRAPARVVSEIVRHLERYPHVERVEFYDETFLFPPAWIEHFAALYKSAVGLPFAILMEPTLLREEPLAVLADAGLDLVFMGVEHGDERFRRERLGRRTSDAALRRAFSCCRELGVETFAFTMVGLPYETPPLAQRTIDFVKELRPHHAGVTIFHPFPGTPLYDDCVREGWIHGPPATSIIKDSILRMPQFPPALIRETADRMMAEFAVVTAKVRARGLYDLVARLDEAAVETDAPCPVAVAKFPEDYDGHWILAHPQTRLRYSIPVPSPAELRFAFGMLPDTWDQPGGAVRFSVEVDGVERFAQTSDPKRRAQDRAVHRHAVPLTARQDRPVRVELVTTAVGSADFVASGWTNTRVVGHSGARQ